MGCYVVAKNFFKKRHHSGAKFLPLLNKEQKNNDFKRDIEIYRKSIQKFMDSGGTSPTLIESWIKKINALNQKKSTYEDVLRQ